jgi:acetyl-CoA carboxylase biotin carboxyl carrier protein
VLKLEEIQKLIKLIDESGVTDFDYEYEGLKITIKKSGVTNAVSTVVQQSPQPPQPVEISEQPIHKEASSQPQQEASATHAALSERSGLHKITSPMVGTFYSAPSPDAANYVKAGDNVSESTVVCIIEAMKLMNEIEAEVRGEIVEVLVENGQLVEYGQDLFLVKPE